MTPHRYTFVTLVLLAGLGFLPIIPLTAQIPGGGNSNPSTRDGPPDPPKPEPPSDKDLEDVEEDPCCEKPNPPKNPGSVDLTFPLEAWPLENSAAGGMRLYFEAAEENMGDPAFLNYNSLASARISEQLTMNIPFDVIRRYVVNQVTGIPLVFDLKAADPLLRPSGNGAASGDRAELRTASGTVTSDPAQATKFRQYRSAGGYMEFALPAGNILKWTGPTGRGLDFPVDPAAGTASMGLEVLRENGKIRQVKSEAGMLDVVTDADGRGYRVVTYLPSEIAAKAGDFYPLVSNAKPSRTVHIVHPLGTVNLVATFIDHAPDSTQDRVRTLTYSYIYTFDDGHQWDMMTEANGLSLKSTRHVIPDPDKAGMRRVIRQITDGSGKLLMRREVIQQFETAWNGWTSLQTIDTPAGDVALRKVQSHRYGPCGGNTDSRKINWKRAENGSVTEFKYDVEGRLTERRSPWLDGADGKLIIEKYSYVPLAPGEVILSGDNRPRTTTREVGTVGGVGNAVIQKTYFADYDDAANGGRHTVIHEEAATPTSAFGDPGNRRNKQVFHASSAGVESGRLMETTNENGLRTQMTYAAREGGGLIETVTGPLDPAGAAKAGLTRRVITQKDGADRALTTREAIFDGSAYVDFQEDLNVYAPQGQLSSVVRTDLKSNRQRVLTSYQWRGDQMIGMTAEDGSVTNSSSDGFDRLVTATTGAVPAAESPLGGAAYPARPAITRTISGTMIADFSRADWGDRTVTTTAGELTLQESSKANARGEIHEETDANHYTTKTDHLKNGLETSVTRPDGGTIVTTQYLDGRIKQRTGTGIVPEYYSYTANAAGGITTTVSFGNSNSPRYQSTTVDLLGRSVIQAFPGHGGVITTTTSYVGGTNRITKVISSAPQTAAKFYEYDTFATITRQGETVRAGATALDLSSSNDRIQDNDATVLNDATGLWLVRKQYAYPNEGTNVATRYLLSETRSKFAGFTGDETQRTYSLDALGNWQQQVTEERVADRVRIERATSNAFAGESVSVYHGGLTVEHRRPGDTVSTRMNYDPLGRLVSTKQPHHAHADAIFYRIFPR